LTSALDGSEWSASRPGRLTPRERPRVTHWIGGWVDLRTSLDLVVEEKDSQPLPGLETPIIQPVAQCYTTVLSLLLNLSRYFSKSVIIGIRTLFPEPTNITFYRKEKHYVRHSDHCSRMTPHFRETDMDGRIISTRILEKKVMKMLDRFICLRICSSVNILLNIYVP
jgi:hypothetical protein